MSASNLNETVSEGTKVDFTKVDTGLVLRLKYYYALAKRHRVNLMKNAQRMHMNHRYAIVSETRKGDFFYSHTYCKLLHFKHHRTLDIFLNFNFVQQDLSCFLAAPLLMMYLIHSMIEFRVYNDSTSQLSFRRLEGIFHALILTLLIKI